MKVAVSDNAVPFVITYRRIIRKPKLVRRRKFVGPVQFAKNVLVKMIDFVEEMAFSTETEVIDPGHSVSVHWAIQVEDPWDVAPGREANLIAFRMDNDMPPCGAHFEIISPPDRAPSRQEQDDAAERGFHARTGGAKFVRPPDPAYIPRPVKPLVQDDDDNDDDSQNRRAQIHHRHDDASSVDLDDDKDLV